MRINYENLRRDLAKELDIIIPDNVIHSIIQKLVEAVKRNEIKE